jgi:hypothetical protein
MAKVTRAQRKHIREQNSRARQARMLAAKKTGRPEIPDKILKRLAALNLPKDPWVYSVVLDALLRGA